MRKRIFFAILALAVFGMRYYFALPESYSWWINKELTIQGVVSEPPEEGIGSVRFTLKNNQFEQFGEWHSIEGKIEVSTRHGALLHYGDFVEMRGVMANPFRPDPRVAAFIKNPQILRIGENQGNYVFAKLFEFRQFLTSRLQAFFPEPAASFAAGILLGVRSSIPREVVDDFRRSGLTHVLALSGFNIIILIQFIELLFSFLPRRTGNICAIFLIVVFTILVGASASVVRASIMGSLGLIARLFGRKATGLRTLAITGYFMALADPFIVIYDIGFQLSFGATAGILVFAEKWKERFNKMPNWFGAKESLITTTAAQVFTLPMIIFYFQSFSAISPLSNIAVLPFIPILMLGSFLSLILGAIIAAPTWILFCIVLATIHFFASIPFGFIDFGTS